MTQSHIAVIDSLTSALGPESIIREPTQIEQFAADYTGTVRGQPVAVVKPRTVEEVSTVLRLCNETRTSVVPCGGNTGLVAGATPDDSGRQLVVSLERLNRIRSIDADNNTITVEAGCLLTKVQGAADSVGRLFPLSLASEGSCQIGGNLSTNAGGTAVLRYGNARDLTLGLEVVLPGGEIWSGLRALRKDNSGYDLKQLFIGAEGTLGIITAAVLKLYPKPSSRSTGLVALPSLSSAQRLFNVLASSCGDQLTAFEVFSRECLALVLKHFPAARDPLSSHSEYYALFELSSSVACSSSGDPFLEEVLLVSQNSVEFLDAVIAKSERERRELWTLRENIAESQAKEGGYFKHDIAVPVSSVDKFVAVTVEALKERYPVLRYGIFGHFGDGNLHFNLQLPQCIDSFQQGELREEISMQVYESVVGFSGSISAEHGLGRKKLALADHYKPALERQLMRQIKRGLDPNGIMNPGKVI